MIEVNEYVRTKDGKIGIFDRYSSRKENSLYKSPFNCFIKIKNRKTPLQCCEDYIVNHSKELIDLVEVGDIVNGCIVVGFGYECVNGNKEKSILVEGKYTKVNYALLNWDIETILTHEQFEQNSYKVGGEDEIS